MESQSLSLGARQLVCNYQPMYCSCLGIKVTSRYIIPPQGELILKKKIGPKFYQYSVEWNIAFAGQTVEENLNFYGVEN